MLCIGNRRNPRGYAIHKYTWLRTENNLNVKIKLTDGVSDNEIKYTELLITNGVILKLICRTIYALASHNAELGDKHRTKVYLQSSMHFATKGLPNNVICGTQIFLS